MDLKLAFPRKGALSFGTRDERRRESGQPVGPVGARTIVGKGLERDDRKLINKDVTT